MAVGEDSEETLDVPVGAEFAVAVEVGGIGPAGGAAVTREASSHVDHCGRNGWRLNVVFCAVKRNAATEAVQAPVLEVDAQA